VSMRCDAMQMPSPSLLFLPRCPAQPQQHPTLCSLLPATGTRLKYCLALAVSLRQQDEDDILSVHGDKRKNKTLVSTVLATMAITISILSVGLSVASSARVGQLERQAPAKFLPSSLSLSLSHPPPSFPLDSFSCSFLSNSSQWRISPYLRRCTRRRHNRSILNRNLHQGSNLDPDLPHARRGPHQHGREGPGGIRRIAKRQNRRPGLELRQSLIVARNVQVGADPP
jgi:hypothetical protein